jgi:uncharacterized protein YndB with AHSA1/START domain
MAEQTSSSITIDAPPADVMAVIADFESYPEWAKGVQTAEVTAAGTGDRAEQVHFALDVSPIKDEYTLAYDWDGDREVTWSLVEGNMLKALDGAYTLVDVSIPLIGLLKRKGEKILIDTALKGLKKRVESL